MSDKIIRQDLELTKAADAFVVEMYPWADGKVVARLWHEWALRRAFERGVAWQQGRESEKK